MKTLVIKLGSKDDLMKELKEVFDNPAKNAKPGTHTLFLKDCKQFYSLLSPQRLELLRYVINHPKEKNTIGSLAKKLKRRQEAVSRDAILLSSHNMIKKTKDKQKVYIKAVYDSLDLKLAGAAI